jgi:hypothetical protein
MLPYLCTTNKLLSNRSHVGYSFICLKNKRQWVERGSSKTKRVENPLKQKFSLRLSRLRRKFSLCSPETLTFAGFGRKLSVHGSLWSSISTAYIRNIRTCLDQIPLAIHQFQIDIFWSNLVNIKKRPAYLFFHKMNATTLLGYIFHSCARGVVKNVKSLTLPRYT